MLCLAVDASGPAASAALVRDGALLAERVLVREKAHASELAPMTWGVLKDALLSVDDVDVVACVIGPGSFTGVRIGVALAQGIALAADKPCCAVDALEALALPYRNVGVTVCPVLDARAGQVYGAPFRRGARQMEDVAEPLEAYADRVRFFGGPYLIVGDGARVHGDRLAALLGEDAGCDDTRVLRASDAALIALSRRDAWIHPAALRPLYLRAPQAERERMARDARS